MSQTCIGKDIIEKDVVEIKKTNDTKIKANKNNLNLPMAESETKEEYKMQLVWRNIIAFIYLHIAALYGVYLLIFEANICTFLIAVILGSAGAYGKILIGSIGYSEV
jgi:hypothetical protein